MTEGRNTGFQKIIRALQANGSPMPVFETDEERTFFLATLFIHPSFTLPTDNANGNVNGDVNGDVNDNAETDEKSAKYEEGILAAIKANPNITIAALAQSIGVSQRTVSRVLKKLKDEKIIRRDGGDRRGKWIIL